MVEINSKAPKFALTDSAGKTVSLSDFAGKWVVLYFYPRDNTPGCTNEACDFTETAPLYKKKNAVEIGVSRDSLESHNKFLDNYNLTIPLLSDPDLSVHKLYGAWGKKIQYGKETEGVIRSTFLISPDGIVVDKWEAIKVRVKRASGEVRHADTVLDQLTKLTKK